LHTRVFDVESIGDNGRVIKNFFYDNIKNFIDVFRAVNVATDARREHSS
jgi:hypothetical protein